MGGVRVFLNPKDIIGPDTGPLADWRREAEREVMAQFHRVVEDGLANDATHRPGQPPGGYRAGAYMDHYGNQNGLGFHFYNTADHAYYAELGRGASHAFQKFGWSRAKPPGKVKWYKATNARDGQHAMRNAVNAAMPRVVDGYTPLP
jgi:hypothetical protein